MTNSALLDKLNDILRHEWTGVAQYSQAAFLVTGLWREVFADTFIDSAKGSFGHARQIGDQIVALGGIPSVERNEIKQSTDLIQLLEHGLEFAFNGATLYNEAFAMAEHERALAGLLEGILLEEQDTVFSFGKLLRDQMAAAQAAQEGRNVA